MWPPSPFAHPTGSFKQAQTIPTALPTDAPAVQVCVNVEWLPLIAGALKQLWLETTWVASSDADLAYVQAQVTKLIDLFNLSLHTAGECGSSEPPFICAYGFAAAANGLPWVDGGRGALVAPTAFFQTGVGWATVSSELPGNSWWQCVSIIVTFPAPVSLDIVEVGLVGWTKGSDFFGELTSNPSGIVVYSSGGVVGSHLVNSIDVPDGNSSFSHDFGGLTCDQVYLSFLAGVTASSPADGLGFIAGIQMTGSGADPACP